MAAETRDRIVQAAGEALRSRGLAGASARGIASIARVNPGLLFYYFETLDDLLLEALRESSEARLESYRAGADQARTAADLVALLHRIYREDMNSGHIRLVCEMVAGSAARPQLGRRVMELMEPWVTLAEEAVDRVLQGSPLRAIASPRELALAAVTFYLGANLVTHLGGQPDAVDGLLASAQRAAGLAEALGEGPSGAQSASGT